MIQPLPKTVLGRSRVEDKRERERNDARAWALVCKAVDARDGKCCRVCGQRASPYAVTLLDRLHRHHLLPRSLGGTDEPCNVASLCADCHDACHTTGLLHLSGDADVRDCRYRLCGIKVERLEDELWKVIAWV